MRWSHTVKKHKKGTLLSFLLVAIVLFWFSLQFPLFKVDYSTVTYSNNNQLLGAHIASDGQWRFPKGDSVPHKFATCLLMFEDEHFYKHPGVNPLSMGRALAQNISQQRVVSGGSTITMQIIRLAHQRKRTVWSKFIEMIQAFRLELSHSKTEVLELYSTHAPFGGNVVGLEAASWRYFQRPPHQLSWAESAMLAVLPNAPGLIHTGKNRTLLLQKRDRLLGKLLNKGKIDSTSYHLSLDEPIPEHPYALPQLAPHLLDYCRKQEEGKIYHLTLNHQLQKRVNQTIHFHHHKLRLNEIHNAAAIVLEVKTGKVLAYCGNTRPIKQQFHQNHVDVIQAPRSTGSILKPFLFAGSLQDGKLLSTSLIADIPTYYKNFAPKNYNRTYAGAVPADEALSRSLNVPAVKMLEEYDIGRFCDLLEKSTLSTIKQSPDHYGLSLILGGAEASLFELSGAYASMTRGLINYTDNNSTYNSKEFQKPILFADDSLQQGNSTEFFPVYSAAATFHTFEALTSVSRPDEEAGWKLFSSSRKIAWKTGTSFGYRDAWAIGITPQYVVAAWVGNATGEGRPGIVGGTTAGPIMFDVFRHLPKTTWFEPPYDDMVKIPVCKDSGFKAGSNCRIDSAYMPTQGEKSELCPYHQLVHLDENGIYRVHSDCYSTSKMQHVKWFTLPPVMEWYYKRNHPLYKKLPPMHPNCASIHSQVMEFIYPQNTNKLYLPVGLDGQTQAIVLKVAHRNSSSSIYWHMDDEYLGETSFVHQMAIQPTAGKHKITLLDEDGNTLYKWINCIGRGDD
ncbi:penicillin-binding protein 1C [Labilibacter marinus]|uniref:penicillin-binding protein 1C n=1 Tax=Labilibacter marinus TaxID=1477105 RepID=UPI00094FB695|nr:penicillin-binding protein 1C [Labilibacter marinus]